MKIISYPDKVISFLGLTFIVSLMILVYSMLNRLWVLLAVLLLWIILSVIVLRKIYVLVSINDNSFTFINKNQTITVSFNSIKYINEQGNYSNTFMTKEYIIVYTFNGEDESSTVICNPKFDKWIKKNNEKFKIIKNMTID